MPSKPLPPVAAAATALACLGAASAIAFATGHDGAHLGPLPVTVWCTLVAFAVQWVAFVPAYLRRTEHFYDLTGSLTYVAVVFAALGLTGALHARPVAIALLVVVWAARLGAFLFRRVRHAGKDGRFDALKHSGPRFFIAWTLQGLWISLTLAAALAALTASEQPPLGALDILGLGVWLAGFAFEVVADRQKSSFKAQHSDRFIDSGLWAWSRHPNYFGEIVLWCGVALVALPTLSGWSYLALVSPLFVALLLTRGSGVPLLEARAQQRWGDDPTYRAYVARTPVLVPRPPRRAATRADD